MRELPLYTVCQFIVTENRCFDTAERIENYENEYM